jgi:hypothetical protein
LFIAEVEKDYWKAVIVIVFAILLVLALCPLSTTVLMLLSCLGWTGQSWAR